jgi:hypothetical protein
LALSQGFCLFLFDLFISFVRPKEMNQRKGRRNRAAGELGEAKCQLRPKLAPATLALMALPFWLKFAPFPGCPRPKIICSLDLFWLLFCIKTKK